MRFALTYAARAAVAAMTVAALAGCTPLDKFAPICPQLSLLKDAADLTRFNGRGEDITDLELDARLVAVPASCSAASRSVVRAELVVAVEMLRGPAKTDRSATVGYFIAVTDAAGKLLDKQTYGIGAQFQPNVDRVTVQSDPMTLDFPTSEQMQAADYRIYVGLILTPQELAYNRRRNGQP